MKKKKFILLIICLCITLGGCGDSDDAIKEEKKEDAYTAIDEAQRDSEYAQAKPVQLDKHGEVGFWDISISSIRETEKVEFDKVKRTDAQTKYLIEKYNYNPADHDPSVITDNKFIIIDMVLKNIGDEPLPYGIGDFKIKNIKTNEIYYNTDKGSDLTLKLNIQQWHDNKNPEYETANRAIKPQETIKFLYGVEVPKDVKLEELLLQSSNVTSEYKNTYFKLK